MRKQIRRNKLLCLLLALTSIAPAFAQDGVAAINGIDILAEGASAQRFMEDKVKVLYRWHTEFPEGDDSTHYAYHDVDRDGNVECLVKDNSGNKGMFWYSGNIIKFQNLGKSDTSITFWPRFIAIERYIAPDPQETPMENLGIEENVVVMKGSRVVLQEKLTSEKIHKIIQRLRKKPAVTWDDLEWQPLAL